MFEREIKKLRLWKRTYGRYDIVGFCGRNYMGIYGEIDKCKFTVGLKANDFSGDIEFYDIDELIYALSYNELDDLVPIPMDSEITIPKEENSFAVTKAQYKRIMKWLDTVSNKGKTTLPIDYLAKWYFNKESIEIVGIYKGRYLGRVCLPVSPPLRDQKEKDFAFSLLALPPVSKEDESFAVQYTDKSFTILSNDAWFVHLEYEEGKGRVNSKFPEYRNLPAVKGSTVECHGDELGEAYKKVSFPRCEKMIGFIIKENTLTLKRWKLDSDTAKFVTIKCKCGEKERRKFVLNSDYFEKILKCFKNNRMGFQFAGKRVNYDNDPIKIYDPIERILLNKRRVPRTIKIYEDNENRSYFLVMPVQGIEL